MIDLACLVADKSIEATITGILQRSEALGIRALQFETIVHPHRDPGCFHQGSELLAGYRELATHAFVVLDRAWDGAPAGTGAEIEARLEKSLQSSGLGEWARAIVIDPELEAWVFSDSPHVATVLGWKAGMRELRAALAARGLWSEDESKPEDPRAATEWALRSARKPRSSAIFRELASLVSLARCQDRSFLRFKGFLKSWFGTGIAEV